MKKEKIFMIGIMLLVLNSSQWVNAGNETSYSMDDNDSKNCCQDCIKVVSPNGGEIWTEDFNEIIWEYSDPGVWPPGYYFAFDVYLKKMGGDWHRIETGAGGRRILVNARNLPDGQYMVKVEKWLWCVDHPEGFICEDTSDDWFTIDLGDPPYPPQLTGPSYGEPSKYYTYSASTTDPEGDDIQYEFDWGDGEKTTTSFYPSGATASVSYGWAEEGIYTVTVRAYDNREWSDSSPPLKVAIDITPPDVEITEPRQGFYLSNCKLIPLPFTVVVGPVTIKVNASDEISDIASVAFFINDVMQFNDTEFPYEWLWDISSKGKNTIEVIAYDNVGKTASNEQTIWKF